MRRWQNPIHYLVPLAILLQFAAHDAGGQHQPNDHGVLRPGLAPRGYLVCVTNEKSGDLTVIDGLSRRVIQTLSLGKRPRGVHVSPDGRWLYAALSGSPIAGPPGTARTEPLAPADRSADGIGVIDVRRMQLSRVIASGSDPEEFALSADGSRLFISNEEAALATMIRVRDGRLERAVRVGSEPEGVTLTPNARRVYVTCETDGDIHVLDAHTGHHVESFRVGGRPRSVAFSADGTYAFIPAETAGQIRVVDTATHRVRCTMMLPDGSRPMKVLLSHDGRRLFVSNGRGGTVCEVDPRCGAVRRTIRVGPRPWGMALSPDDRWLYVANGPSDDVSVVDVTAGTEVTRIGTGSGPWGVEIVTP